MQLTAGLESPSSRDWANRCVTRRDLFRLSTHTRARFLHTKKSVTHPRVCVCDSMKGREQQQQQQQHREGGEKKAGEKGVDLMMDCICFVDSGLLENHKMMKEFSIHFSDSI